MVENPVSCVLGCKSYFPLNKYLNRLFVLLFKLHLIFCLNQFGGKLLTYNLVVTQTQTQPPTQFTQHILTIQQVVIDSELIQRAEKLENALCNANFMDYCLYKISEHNEDQNLLMAWKLVALHLENDQQKQKEILLNLLGFDNCQTKKDSIDDLCDLTTNQLTTQGITNNHLSESEFFNRENISNIAENRNLQKSLAIDTSNACLGTQINRAILNGDVESVIKNCIQNNNWTEGILLCCFVSPENTASTLRQYFDYCLSSKPESWSSLLWCIISGKISIR